ncbi:MAG: hypothetical protein ACKVPY_11675 [Paracoccaceae bacterium]
MTMRHWNPEGIATPASRSSHAALVEGAARSLCFSGRVGIAPEILRFGFTPLYTTMDDVRNAIAVFSDILASGEWDKPEYRRRAAVT